MCPSSALHYSVCKESVKLLLRVVQGVVSIHVLLTILSMTVFPPTCYLSTRSVARHSVYWLKLKVNYNTSGHYRKFQVRVNLSCIEVIALSLLL